MKNILIVLLILSTVSIYAGDSKQKLVEGLTDNFYYKIFGVWDHDLLKEFEGSPMGFSWGLGSVIKSSSTIIDFNLIEEKDALYFQGFSLYEILKIIEINENVFEIFLYWEYRD